MPRRKPSIGKLNQLVGRNVRALREERDLSQARLGRDLGEMLNDDGRELPKQVVSKIEKGLRPLDVNELVIMALALNKPVTYLLTGHEGHEDRSEVELPNWTLTLTELLTAVVGENEATVVAQAVREARQAAVAEMSAVVLTMGSADVVIRARGTPTATTRRTGRKR